MAKNRDGFINRLAEFQVIDLMADPRIESKDFSPQELAQLDGLLQSLNDEQKSCTDDFLSDYKDRVLEHCLQAGYAQHIGGGCYHIIGYSVSAAVQERALESCG